MNYEEEMRAEENARYDSVRERFAGSAPDPETEHRYAMEDEAEELGMTYHEYVEYLRQEARRKKLEQDIRQSDEDGLPF